MAHRPLRKLPESGVTPPPAQFTNYQKLVVGVLTFLQFTIILDFMVLSPLGAMLMPSLHVTAAQFSLIVSVYAFSAGISGFLTAGFADRFDRKKLLLFFYSGFLLGTLFCGTAPTYHFLLAARMITGLFGGVVGSVAFAIITDLFAFEMRGRVMGFIQTAFAASQILGIPVGLFLANLMGWHAPFLMIVSVGAIVGGIIVVYLKPIDAHLKLSTERKAWQHLIATVSQSRYLQAFATTALLSTGGFMLMPFSSAYSVHNLGIDIHTLPLVYLVTGLCAMVAGPLIGRASDRFGKFRMFVFGTVLSTVMVLIYTRLGVTPLPMVMFISAVMFVGISSRMISSQALISAIPAAASRGAFMSVSSSIQQISGGFASILAGLIVAEESTGVLRHFDILGYVVVGAMAITVVMMYFIHRTIPETPSAS
jgi:predicted MFS family arabinose efflux permease